MYPVMNKCKCEIRKRSSVQITYLMCSVFLSHNIMKDSLKKSKVYPRHSLSPAHILPKQYLVQIESAISFITFCFRLHLKKEGKPVFPCNLLAPITTNTTTAHLRRVDLKDSPPNPASKPNQYPKPLISRPSLSKLGFISLIDLNLASLPS
jgi:hypothetical protein